MHELESLYSEWVNKENRLQRLNSIAAEELDIPWESLPDEPNTIEDFMRIMLALPKRPIPNQLEYPVAVILAGGRGTRMGNHVRQKSLCPIAGRPALLRAMDTYRDFGIDHFVIVVGVGYKDVLESLGTNSPHVTFLFQEEQLGTGHAARLAARYLSSQNFTGSVLIAMGDKYISRQALDILMPNHAQAQADLTLATASKIAWPDSGRVVIDERGRVCAILERPDVVQRQLVDDFFDWPTNPVSCHEFREHALRCWNRPEKLRKILGDPFWDALQNRDEIHKCPTLFPIHPSETTFTLSDTLRLQASEVEAQCDQVNISVYIFKAKALYEATERLRSNNAQGELYLTDAVYDLTGNHHSEPYHVTAAPMPGDYDVMGFNTLDELAAIERRVSNL